MIVLALLADVKYGGWVTRTATLFRMFTEGGYKAMVVRLANRTEKHLRPFTATVPYQNLSMEAMLTMARTADAFYISAAGKTHSEQAAALLQEGASIHFADPTEFRGTVTTAAKESGAKIITERRATAEGIRDLGLDVEVIPYAYYRKHPHGPRPWKAVTISRLDWDKHTDIVAGANAVLPEKDRVKIYGAENRQFTYHKLDSKFPDWRKDYHGPFPTGSGAELAAGAKFAIDLSTIKGDGGGLQNSFLEAWDSGAVLVIHKGWVIPGHEMVPGKNCLAVENSGELRDILTEQKSHRRITRNGAEMLAQNEPKKILERYKKAFKLS